MMPAMFKCIDRQKQRRCMVAVGKVYAQPSKRFLEIEAAGQRLNHERAMATWIMPLADKLIVSDATASQVFESVENFIENGWKSGGLEVPSLHSEIEKRINVYGQDKRMVTAQMYDALGPLSIDLHVVALTLLHMTTTDEWPYDFEPKDFWRNLLDEDCVLCHLGENVICYTRRTLYYGQKLKEPAIERLVSREHTAGCISFVNHTGHFEQYSADYQACDTTPMDLGRVGSIHPHIFCSLYKLVIAKVSSLTNDPDAYARTYEPNNPKIVWKLCEQPTFDLRTMRRTLYANWYSVMKTDSPMNPLWSTKRLIIISLDSYLCCYGSLPVKMLHFLRNAIGGKEYSRVFDFLQRNLVSIAAYVVLTTSLGRAVFNYVRRTGTPFIPVRVPGSIESLSWDDLESMLSGDASTAIDGVQSELESLVRSLAIVGFSF